MILQNNNQNEIKGKIMLIFLSLLDYLLTMMYNIKRNILI